MDSITHTLFGIGLYYAIPKQKMDTSEKRSLLFTAVLGSHAPDLDVVSKYFDSHGMYQMWHRGITHSLFMVPVWAIVLTLFAYLLWRTINKKQIFFLAVASVFVHITSDLFNAWGTGYFEPFSTRRISFGTIPIIDFVIWTIFLIAFILANRKRFTNYRVFQLAFLVILIHVLIQSSQGYYLYHQAQKKYDQVTLSASFIPWQFRVIGKNESIVEISEAMIWKDPEIIEQLDSAEETDLEHLFKQNPKARTLYAWSPFVVIVDNDRKIGVYDPRFYREGQSFLFEYIEKQHE